jgi:hypothetical protein
MIKAHPDSFVLPDGRQLERLSEQTFKLKTLEGEHEHYIRSEEIVYSGSLPEQYKATNK